MRKRQRRARADGAEQIGAVVALVGRLARARSPSRPLPHEAVVLADAGLVFTGEFSCQDRIERALRWSRNGSRGGLLWIGIVSDSRRRKRFNSATRWVGSGRPSPVLRALMSASQERRDGLSRTPGWRATRRCDFRCARAPAPGIPAPDGPLRVFLFHG